LQQSIRTYQFVSKYLLAVALLVVGFSVQAQNRPMTLDQLTEEGFLEMVEASHPVIRQADILNRMALMERRSASGAFDPKLYGDWDAKSFDNKNYFQNGEAGLKLPGWFGMEFKAGYNYTSGVFLNPENNLPMEGQAVVGLKVPLLRGLVIDERRTRLFQARNLEDLNAAKADELRNQILFEATKAYWNWYYANRSLEIVENAITISAERFQAVKDGYFAGDKPAIDTVEALIQLQNWQILRQDAYIQLNNTRLDLSNFLWTENGSPMPVAPGSNPADPTVNPDAVLETINLTEQGNWITTHPSLRKYIFKQKELEYERKWKREQFKPQLDVEYNLLGNGIQFQGDGANMPFYNNYKWGATFSFPLFLRKASGGYEKAQLKLLDNDLQRQQKQLEIENKIRQITLELQNLQTQYGSFRSMVENYQRLYDGEREKFAIGESSLFLINSRETKLLENRIKLVKLESEIYKTRNKLLWAGGRLVP
jgi:outer membrane protein TolC